MSEIHKRARHLRANATPHERALWRRISRGQLDGFLFRRQHPLGRYVADFACLERRLVLELDGSHHALSDSRDGDRDEWLRQEGYRILRVWNSEIDANMDGVLEAIARALAEP